MNTNKQSVCFKRKTTNFSIVSNPIIDDAKISPAAGWLYVLIQRWITYNAEGFICSKSFLASKYQAGSRMFNRAWDELKEAGYLKMYSHPTGGWICELLDEAQPNTPHTYYLDMNNEVKSTNVDRAERKASKSQENAGKDHYPQNVGNGDHYLQNDSNGNDSDGNVGNIINTKSNYSDNTKGNTLSLSLSIYPNEGTEQKEKKIDRLIVTEEMTNQIKQDIEAETLADEIGAEDVAFAVDVIAELRTVNEPVVFNKREVAPDCVRHVANAIRREHVIYVFKCIRAQTRPIGNIRGYLRTSLFNAPLTLNSYNANVEARSRKQDQSGSFDTDEFFLASVRRSFGDDFDPAIFTP